MESEKTLLPAIEMMRKQKTGQEGSERMRGLAALPPSTRQTGSLTLSAQDSQRLEELKRKKESERLDRERAMWREASRLPKILEEMLEPVPPKELVEVTPPPADDQKDAGGFFSKLRHGKLLG